MRRTKLLLVLAALSFIPTLWLHTVGEEGFYAISSMEMWQTRNWLIQTIYGVAVQRPPLINWLVIGISNLIGWSHVVLAMRIVSATATLGMVYWLYWLCKRLFNDKSFALFTSLACLALVDLLLYRGWLSYTDPLFSFFTFGAIATLWVAAAERNKGWLFVSILLISCALLTKALTAYVFYCTAGLVLLMNRNHRSFLLSPGSLLVLLSIVITPIVWLTSIPQLNSQGSSLLHEIMLKLSAVGGIEYLERLITYPLDAAWRLGPASLLALYLLLRKRELQSETAIDHYKSAVVITILTITPYWLAPQGGIRYLLPVYPLVALISARIIWRAGEPAHNLALNWFAGVIALKFLCAIVLFPYYQTHVRGQNYVIAARHIMQKTAGYPLYAYDFRDVAESIVTQIDIDRNSHSFVTSPPATWDNGFLLSPDADESKGHLVEKIPLGGDQIYLLCRGAACRQAVLTEPATAPAS